MAGTRQEAEQGRQDKSHLAEVSQGGSKWRLSLAPIFRVATIRTPRECCPFVNVSVQGRCIPMPPSGLSTEMEGSLAGDKDSTATGCCVTCCIERHSAVSEVEMYTS